MCQAITHAAIQPLPTQRRYEHVSGPPCSKAPKHCNDGRRPLQAANQMSAQSLQRHCFPKLPHPAQMHVDTEFVHVYTDFVHVYWITVPTSSRQARLQQLSPSNVGHCEAYARPPYMHLSRPRTLIFDGDRRWPDCACKDTA